MRSICMSVLLRLDSVSATGVWVHIILYFLDCRKPDIMGAGIAGMVINYALQATGTVESFIQNFTELELKMNAMERIKHYTTVRPSWLRPTRPVGG